MSLRSCPWTWPNLLSLDAPLVAILWQMLFTASLHVHVASIVTAIMALVVWLIYVGDRILDSFRTEGPHEPALHRFYRAHRAAFLPPFLIVFVFTSWMAWTHLDPRTLRDGMVLALVVAGYFAVVHLISAKPRAWFPKEIVVAILFGVGTYLPVGVRVRHNGTALILPFLLFILVLWMNTLLIEYSEWVRLRGGQTDRPHRLTVLAGRHFVPFGVSVGGLAVCMLASGSFQALHFVLLAEAISVLALNGLGWYWKNISSHIVRVAADAALLTPGFFLLLLRR